MDKKTSKFKIYIGFCVSIFIIYLSAWASLIIESSIRNIEATRPIESPRFYYFSVMLFAIGLALFAVYYILKNKRYLMKYVYLMKYGIIFFILIGVVLTGYRYTYFFFYYSISGYYVGLFQWKQIFSFFLLYIIGSFLVYSSVKNISMLKVAIYGFIMGCCLWGALSGIYIFSGIYYSWLTMLIGIIIVIGGIFIIRKSKLPNVAQIKEFILYTLIFINVCIIISHFNMGKLSSDSHLYINFGNLLGKYGGLISSGIDGNIVSARSIFVPSLNAFAYMFDFYDAETFMVLLYASFIVLFVDELRNLLVENGIKKLLWIPIILALCMLISSPSVISVGLWHLNNGPTMAMMFMLAVFINLCIKNRSLGYAILSAILLVGLIFCRVEMPLYVLILLVYISTLPVTKKQMIILVSLPIFALAVYYIGFFVIYGLEIESRFLNLNRSLPIIALYIAFGVYLLIFWRKYFLKFQKHIVSIIITSMIGIFILMSIFNLDDFVINMIVIFWHTLFGNYSGYQWHMMIGLLPLVLLVIRRNQDVKVSPTITFIAVSFALFIVDIFMFRDVPLRFGEGDSGNRLIAQLYPFCVFIFVAKISPLLCEYKQKKDSAVKNK